MEALLRVGRKKILLVFLNHIPFCIFFFKIQSKKENIKNDIRFLKMILY